MYGPDYLLQKDIVFVSFNYRVGAFGNFYNITWCFDFRMF